MKIMIVKSEEEARQAIKEAEAEGLKPAAYANTWFPPGHVRMTFLPKEAFLTEDNEL